ncbi:zinc finger protein C2H2-type protein [Fadolivirus algeromassiliense]|jgi:hypothetical protein|uniref:Zinc finger protein C2H2-type protein n=1 Tax=Fadolivirus FV1/VV64 TaxID=3070911 RepID=A0A7D3QV23_9VIRU|nr:zinc finger protein C2H2-type protein [Fadolivirus algeromassiliense]QKF93586.1 zinc finger protein C2H2-type protein [Fadolivirus FV1/VV64]
MKYLCGTCNYSTNDKSNFNKHINSLAHSKSTKNIDRVNKNVDREVPIKSTKFDCDKCKKSFTCKQSLSYHKLHSCKGISYGEVNEMREQIKFLMDKLQHYDKILQQPQINKTTNNYISVKNYVQNNYPDAPALESIKEYKKLTFENNTLNDFIDELIYNHNNLKLHKFLGKFIIEYYKKEDPSEQSMWSSDVSRLTYIIKEFLDNTRTEWNHDYKGVKVKMYVINPLLKYIRSRIDEYWISNIDNIKTCEISQVEKYNKIYKTLYQIKKDISSDLLGNNILRFIAPYFHMDKKTYDSDIINDLFIDE